MPKKPKKSEGHPLGRGLKVIAVPSWGDFPSAVSLQLGEVFSSNFIFRGQSSSTFSLVSSFDRRYGTFTSAKRRQVYKNLETLFSRIADRDHVEAPAETVELMALAQHFGLTTRMLDWSESRYVGCFFAFTSLALSYRSSLDVELVESEIEECVSVFAIDCSSSVWNEEGVAIKRPPSGSNDRVRRQRGLYTLNRSEHLSIEEYVASYIAANGDDVDRYPLYRFDIPAREARSALRDLHEMRISHSELFPGLEGIARETMLLEWLGGPI